MYHLRNQYLYIIKVYGVSNLNWMMELPWF